MSPLSHRLRFAGVLTILLFCAGCLPVDDIGGTWEKASLDPALEGAWKDPAQGKDGEDFYTVFTKRNDYYAEEFPDPGSKKDDHLFTPVRTLKIGGANFLIENSQPDQPQKKGMARAGWILRYELKDGKLVWYVLKEEVVVDAIKSGAVKGVIRKSDTRSSIGNASLSVLDEATLDFLAAQVKKPECWQEWVVYIRVKNLEKEMEESRARMPKPANPFDGSPLK